MSSQNDEKEMAANEKLVEAELKRITSARKSVNFSSFVLVIRLRGLRPSVTRTVRVPARLSIRAFVDKVS
jgi:predicted DNA-binding ribbon-helix-helix protein